MKNNSMEQEKLAITLTDDLNYIVMTAIGMSGLKSTIFDLFFFLPSDRL